jgi:hypothetical protein
MFRNFSVDAHLVGVVTAHVPQGSFHLNISAYNKDTSSGELHAK